MRILFSSRSVEGFIIPYKGLEEEYQLLSAEAKKSENGVWVNIEHRSRRNCGNIIEEEHW